MSTLSETPRSPRADRLTTPSWLDARLVFGVLLVLGSVLIGARVLSSADRTQAVWVLTHDLAPGSVLTDEDLRSSQVRLLGSANLYAGAVGTKPVGYVLRRGLGRDELLPIAALSRPEADVAYRQVTVPVPVGHLPPDLRHGAQVDIYETPSDKAVRAADKTSGTTQAPQLVLRAVSVDRVVRAGGLGASGQDAPVVLSVRPGDVLTLLSAMAQGRIDLVQVPVAQQSLPAGSAGPTP